MMTGVTIFIQLLLCYHAAGAVTDAEQRILNELAEKFLSSDSDFMEIKKNADFFPFVNAVELNRNSGRTNYNVTDLKDFGREASSYLNSWRGFPLVSDMEVDRDVRLLFNETNPLVEGLSSESMGQNEIEKLPRAWQYILPQKFYDGFNLSGDAWADIVNKQPLNSAFLFKVSLLLRNEDDIVKDQFINSLKLSGKFRDDLGYILGYRWGVDQSALAEKYKMVTLLHLPGDVVMNISSKQYKNMGITNLLRDSEAWKDASPQSRVAWFTKINEEESGWQMSKDNVENFGHLLSGAPLAKLEELAYMSKEDETLSKAVGNLLNRTEFNSLKVQELWEALPLKERLSYKFLISKLDVSQIIALYDDKYLDLFNQRSFFDREWLSEDRTVMSVPWPNIVEVGIMHIANTPVASLNEINLLTLGKFITILYPPQLEEIPSSAFTSRVLPSEGKTSILSPLLTHCQAVAIYNKVIEYPEAFKDNKLPAALISAMPSKDILQLGSPSSFFPKMEWTEDKEALVLASETFTPAQMFALHQVARGFLWQSDTLSTILLLHPQCLSDVPPQKFRAEIGAVIDALQRAGPGSFHKMAASVQRLPRRLLMAWLEAALTLPGSHTSEGWWNSDVLLDRDLAQDSNVASSIKDHPLNSQFQRFTSTSMNKTALPSLALAGLSCHCIEKVETPDSLEVLSLYRYHVESTGRLTHMPAMTRKCWAKKVRQFLRLKAEVYGVEVTNELELLSMLSTSDIKAIGGEVFLTWGAAALTGIAHPQVRHEVLMTIAHNPPHFLLHNGVGLADVERLANTLLDSLSHNCSQGQGPNPCNASLSTLTHMHNLLPFADDRVLDYDRVLSASPEDAKLYVSSVLRVICKSVCLPSRLRKRMRTFLLAAYGDPASWTALDLVEMGDLLVVFNRADHLKISPTSLRRAANQLVENSLFTEPLGDVRGFTGPALYHEACSAWLGKQEGLEFTKAWRALAELYVLGNHLQIVVIEHNKATKSRKKRQADDSDFVKNIYVKVMNDVKIKYDSGELSSDQKVAATAWISETQNLLGVKSFEVLGMEVGNKTTVEIYKVLKEAKESGNMTDEQDTAMQDLAIGTQVRIIQGILGVFGYTAEAAASNYNVSVEDVERLLKKPTFGSDAVTFSTVSPDLQRDTANNVDLPRSPILSSSNTTTTSSTTSTTPTPTTTTTTSTTTTTVAPPEPTSTSSSTTSAPTTTSPSSTTVSSTTVVGQGSNSNIPAEASSTDQLMAQLSKPSKSVFLRYQPQSGDGPEASQFINLPSLSAVQLGCDCIKASGDAASALSREHIEKMTEEEAYNCLDTLGKLPWPQSTKAEIWAALLEKLPQHLGVQPDARTSANGVGSAPLKREKLMLLANLLPAAAEANPDLLDMREENIDGISILGKSKGISKATAGNLVQRYLENKVAPSSQSVESGLLSSTEVASLGNLLCGFSDAQWTTLVTFDIFASTLVDHLAHLDCAVGEPVKEHLASLLLQLYGPPDAWTTSDLYSVGWVASAMSPSNLTLLMPHAMEGLTPLALRHLDPPRLQALGHLQLAGLNPHTASFIRRDQLLPHTTRLRRRAIRAAGGEAPLIRTLMNQIEVEMAPSDQDTDDDIVDSRRDGRLIDIPASKSDDMDAPSKEDGRLEDWQTALIAVFLILLLAVPLIICACKKYCKE